MFLLSHQLRSLFVGVHTAVRPVTMERTPVHSVLLVIHVSPLFGSLPKGFLHCDYTWHKATRFTMRTFLPFVRYVLITITTFRRLQKFSLPMPSKSIDFPLTCKTDPLRSLRLPSAQRSLSLVSVQPRC